MEDAIRDFNKQFAWKPSIVNSERLKRGRGFVVGWMGGSHLAAGILAGWKPELDVLVHRDYGLPALSDAKDLPAPSTARQAGRLYIASSYSGNTEETIDFAQTAQRLGYAVAAISVGGKLLEFAAANNLPHIVIPDTHIQPRSALGFSMNALAALIGDAGLQKELALLADILKPEELREAGKKLAAELRSKVPVVYASARNSAVAYNWKIKFNETGKIPAFYNVFPELNHNEMTGFDLIDSTEGLSRRFHFIFLSDTDDHPQLQKRMKVTRTLYEDRGLSVTEVSLGKTTPALADSGTPFTKGDSRLTRIFVSLLIADWTALSLSEVYGTEAEQVPMVEQFKKLITVTGNWITE